MCPSPFRWTFLYICLCLIGIFKNFVETGRLHAQERDGAPADRQSSFDPRRWLEQLDANKNGKLDPNELTGRARDFAAPKLKELGFNPDQSISIKSITHAVEKKRALKNAGPPAVPGFGVTPEMTLVPGFDVEQGSALAGIGTLEERYDPRVLVRLQQTLDRYDKNKDGILDPREISEARWIYGDPTKNDLNKDGFLTKTELAERYLAREAYEKTERKKSDRELGKLYRQPEEWKQRWAKADKNEKRRMGEFWKREFDKLKDDDARQKTRALFGLGGEGGEEKRVEQNRSQQSVASEASEEGQKYRRVYQYADLVAQNLEKSLSAEFTAKDLNRDGQIQMSEFESNWTSFKLQAFQSLDTNGDGVLTATEWAGDE